VKVFALSSLPTSKEDYCPTVSILAIILLSPNLQTTKKQNNEKQKLNT
jgi:hypothetical protein